MKKENLIWAYITPIILMLANLLVKGYYLGANPIAGDEPFSIYVAQMDTFTIVELLSQGNNPPLYELILHFWIKIFGISGFAVRLPSLIFSTLTIFFIYCLGHKHINKRVGLYAAIIFVFSNYHIMFAHESRGYALLGLLSVMSMYYFLNLISAQETKRKQSYAYYILSSTLLIYTHYFGFFILMTQGIFLIINFKVLKLYWKHVLYALGLLLLLYSPNIFVLTIRLVDSTANGTWLEAPSGIDEVYSMLRRFSNAPVVTVLLLVVLVTACVKFFVVRNRLEDTSIAKGLVSFWFLFIFVFMFLISFKAPMFLDRYLMPSAIAFPLLIAVSSDFLIIKKGWKYVIPSLVCLLFIVTVKPNMTNKRDTKGAIEKTMSLKDQSTLVFIAPSRFDINFMYYADRPCFENYNTRFINTNSHNCLNTNHIYPLNLAEEMESSRLEQCDRVVFLDAGADFTFPNNGILSRLNNEFQLDSTYQFYEIFRVYDFRKKSK